MSTKIDVFGDDCHLDDILSMLTERYGAENVIAFKAERRLQVIIS